MKRPYVVLMQTKGRRYQVIDTYRAHSNTEALLRGARDARRRRLVSASATPRHFVAVAQFNWREKLVRLGVTRLAKLAPTKGRDGEADKDDIWAAAGPQQRVGHDRGQGNGLHTPDSR